MVVNGKGKRYKSMFCKCGCGNGVVLKADNDKDFGVSLQLVSDNFYTGCNNRRNSIKEKVKLKKRLNVFGTSLSEKNTAILTS